MGNGRAPCCDKNKVKRGPWSPQEDLKLITFIQKHGHPNWRSLPKQAGLLRCGKSCRLRWINYLRPDVKRGNLTKEEEDTIMKLHKTLGNKWSKIASELPGRTDNEIKNVWHTHLKKKLLLKNTSDQESSCITSHSSSSSSSTPGHHQAETTTLIPQKTTDNIDEQSSENNLNKDQCSTDQSSPTPPICKLQDDHHHQQQLELVASAGSSILYQGGGPDDNNNKKNYSNSKVLNEFVDKPRNSSDLLEIPLEADYDFWNMLDDENIGVSNDHHHLHQHQVHSSDAESMKYWIREIEKDLGLEPQESSSSSSSDLTIGLLSDDIDLWPNIGNSGLI